MNPRTFLQQYAESADRERLVEAVYDDFLVYCRENDIPQTPLQETCTDSTQQSE